LIGPKDDCGENCSAFCSGGFAVNRPGAQLTSDDPGRKVTEALNAAGLQSAGFYEIGEGKLALGLALFRFWLSPPVGGLFQNSRLERFVMIPVIIDRRLPSSGCDQHPNRRVGAPLFWMIWRVLTKPCGRLSSDYIPTPRT